MSALFEQTPACSPNSPLQLSLAAGPLERGYKYLLFLLVALPAGYLCYFASLRLPAAHDQRLTMLLLLAALVIFVFAIAVVVYRRPFNGAWQGQYLRLNDKGWWLGAGDQWQPVVMAGEQLICPWLIHLRLRGVLTATRYSLWLWADGANLDAHRRLRVLLYQSCH